MKSNEEYLDELLKSMGESTTDDSAITKLQDDNLDNVEELSSTISAPEDTGMGKMDQSMIDALLAAAGDTQENAEIEMQIEDEQVPKMIDQAELDVLLMAEAEEDAKKKEMEEIEEMDFSSLGLDEPEIKNEFNLQESVEPDNMSDESSMLAQLMAEMAEESLTDDGVNFDDESLLTEESIEALLSAAQSGADSSLEEEGLSLDNQNSSEMEEIEALLNMADGAKKSLFIQSFFIKYHIWFNGAAAVVAEGDAAF